MLRHALFACLLIFSLNVAAQSPEYSRIKIWTNDAGLAKLSAMGIETDHGDVRRGVWLINDFSATEIERINAAGFRTEVLIEDVQAYYRESAGLPASTRSAMVMTCDQSTPPDYPVPFNFSLGSMAGYFFYQEMLDNLDSMVSMYPNLITIKAAIPGTNTIENRPVYWVKISDNPNVDEAEPEMLYTAVHHAREPGSMSQLIYYMWYLLENYSNGGEIDGIINNTELYFIPCINPDGYLYNETMSPGGGGMWRKNMRDNLDGTFGVDLNRNYGFNWGFDDDGSSPFSSDETYRGTAPFSEPETQLVSSFINSRNFKLALNYHTHGNQLIYPWGYQLSLYTPDSAQYTDYGKLLTTYNSYTAGTADQTVGYVVNGSSDDWMYGDQVAKPKIFAFTPETGDSFWGFWPPSSEIIPICQLNMFQNLTAAQLCGRFAKVKDTSPTIIPSAASYFYYDFHHLGLDPNGTFTVTLTPVTSNILLTGGSKSYSLLSPNQLFSDSISFLLNTPMTHGDPVTFLITVDNGWYVRTDTIKKYFGAPVMAYASNGNTIAGWINNSWGVSTSVFYSPIGSITDSPIGNYDSFDFDWIELSTPIDLTTAIKAQLTFYARWEVEQHYDYAQVLASIDNGVSWTPLCGKYTVPGNLNQDPDAPVYEGTQLAWVKEEMSLDDFVGNSVLIRYLIVSDGWLEMDGFYFDDVLVEKVLPGTNSIEEVSNQQSLTLMPNPATGYVYVNTVTPMNGSETIFITDISGRDVLKVRGAEGLTSVRIETTGLATGVYTVMIASGNERSQPRKLIIQ